LVFFILSSAHNKGNQARKISTVKEEVGQAAHNIRLPSIVASKNLNRNVSDLTADKKLTGNICVKITVFA